MCMRNIENQNYGLDKIELLANHRSVCFVGGYDLITIPKRGNPVPLKHNVVVNQYYLNVKEKKKKASVYNV